MGSLHRVTLSVTLTLAPLMGTGCSISSSRQVCARDVQCTEMKMNSARLEESRGNLVEAKQLYTEIHRQNPQNAECSHRLAVVCTHLNQHSEAEVYYAQAYALSPNDPELLADIGYAAYLRKDYPKSQTLFELSVKLNGNDVRTIGNLAIVQAWQENDQASLATFRRIHDEVDAIRHLAAIQIARGDNDRGQKNYELARNLDSTRKEKSTAVAQASASNTEIIPVELPAPSFSIPNALPPTVAAPTTNMTKLLQAEEVDQGVSRTSERAIEAPVELPAPVELSASVEVTASVESVELPAPEPRLPMPLSEKLDRQSEPTNPALEIDVVNSPASEIPELSSTQEVKFFNPSSSVDKSTTDVIVLPMPSTVEETPIAVPQPQQKTTPPAIWRRTQQPTGFQSSRQPVESMAPKVEKTVTISALVEDSTAFNNVCLVTLIEERRITSTLAQFETEHLSQKYRFSSAEALEKFRQAPEKYAPMAGGLDIVSVRDERKVVQGSLSFAICYQRRLYLFSTSAHAEAFLREPHKYVAND